MLRRAVLGLGLVMLSGVVGRAAGGGADGDASQFSFTGIDGGKISLADFAGGPVLVVNTASRCAFTGQYDGLQALYDHRRADGLTVLGVPSNSFRQELASEAAVKDFCEVNFSIDFPMTEIVPVTGSDAHPFYVWARSQGVAPSWNFHKILLDANGRIAGSFGTSVGPGSPTLARAIDAIVARP